MIWPFSGATIEPVVRLAQVAEKCGFETVYVGDSQMIWNDVWVALTSCALATERVKLGPGVTNTVTRHPAVTANAVTSLNMVSGRRAVLGVGAGDSAVRTAGLSPARLSQLRERVDFMRALLGNQEVDALPPSEGKEKETWGKVTKVRVVGTDEWGSVPIHIAVMSPKSAAVAAEISDGVIVDGHMGGNAEGAAATVEAAKEGAKRAGKDVASVRLIAAIDAAVEDDRRKAFDQVRPTAARNIARKPWLPKTLGEEHADVVKKVSEAYQFKQHLDLTAEHRELIPDEVAQKCTIAGTPQDCVDKARELEAAGITDIAIFITSQDEAASRNTLERFSREVFPKL
jgi:5,10-methylenetetrahydromethanopterin reductase